MALVLTGAVSRSEAAELGPQDNQLEDLRDDHAYRSFVDGEGKAWAIDLMFMYRWKAKYLNDWKSNPQFPIEDGDFPKRFHSELSWLSVTAGGLAATFDFKHADTNLAGSTSRFVQALTASKNFWTEVRNQCIEIRALRKASLSKLGRTEPEENLKTCAERFRSDLKLSQLVGSNVSLFVGGGLVISVGKRVFKRYAAKWVTARLLPVLPAVVKSRYFIGGTFAAVVVVPSAFVVAGMSSEFEKNKDIYENMDVSLTESQVSDQQSADVEQLLQLERQVLELSIWIKGWMPASNLEAQVTEDVAQRFLFDLKLHGPGWAALSKKREELDARRLALEAELSLVPNVTERLRAIALARKAQSLADQPGSKRPKKEVPVMTPEDSNLLRKAQYLAALRVVLPTL